MARLAPLPSDPEPLPVTTAASRLSTPRAHAHCVRVSPWCGSNPRLRTPPKDPHRPPNALFWPFFAPKCPFLAYFRPFRPLRGLLGRYAASSPPCLPVSGSSSPYVTPSPTTYLNSPQSFSIVWKNRSKFFHCVENSRPLRGLRPARCARLGARSPRGRPSGDHCGPPRAEQPPALPRRPRGQCAPRSCPRSGQPRQPPQPPRACASRPPVRRQPPPPQQNPTFCDHAAETLRIVAECGVLLPAPAQSGRGGRGPGCPPSLRAPTRPGSSGPPPRPSAARGASGLTLLRRVRPPGPPASSGRGSGPPLR